MKSIFNNRVVDISTYVFYGFVIFCMPSFSTISSLFAKINIAVIFCFCIFLFIRILFRKKISIPLISIAPFSFLLVVILSTAINRGQFILTTPLILLLSIYWAICFKSLNLKPKYLMLSILMSILAFSILFLILIPLKVNVVNGNNRYGGLFGDENEIALYLSLGVCTSIYFLLFKQKVMKLVSLCGLPMIFCGILTGSKAFVLSCILIFIFAIFIKNGKRKIWTSVIILIVIFVSLLLLVFLDIPFLNKYSSRITNSILALFGFGDDMSSQNRLLMFYDGMGLFLRRPILGFGIRGYYYYSAFGGGGWSHNQFSEILCSYGLLGFACYFSCFAIPLIFSNRNGKENKELILLLIFFLITWFLSMALDTLKIFAVVFSIIFCITKIEVGYMKKKVTVCAFFGTKKQTKCDGATTKANNVFNYLKTVFPESKKINMPSWRKHFISNTFKLICAYISSNSLIILPNDQRLKIFAKFKKVLSWFNPNLKIIYMVVGGWLPDFLQNNPKMIKSLDSFSAICPETKRMVEMLKVYKLDNVYYSPVFSSRNPINDTYSIQQNTQTINVCTFSRVAIDKGIPDAIEAVRKVNSKMDKQYHLDVYGKIKPDEKDYFDSLFSNNEDICTYHGILKDEDVIKTINNHFLLLFPTYFYGEGFPATVLESLIASVPVIASDWKYNKEIISDKETGFIFKVKNVEQLTQILYWCAEHTLDVLSMRKKCLEASKNYTAEIAMEKVVSIIKSN